MGVFGDHAEAVNCFVAGTRILADHGEVAVEELAFGERVVTAAGQHRPIKWLGCRALDCRTHPRPRDVRPVRIAAHAFGDNKPTRDLYLSPGHAICADANGEVLVPVKALINGSTVIQADAAKLTYWHIELATHDILLAENLPAESYLDLGNRQFFRGADRLSSGGVPDAPPAAAEGANFCRPVYDSGVRINLLRAQLRENAKDLGWRLQKSNFADLCAIADGERLEAKTTGLAAEFAVPAATRNLTLVCTPVRPSGLGLSDDTRELGVYLQRLTFDDDSGAPVTIGADDERLRTGFYNAEQGRRWTSGQARIPHEMFADISKGFTLRVELANPALPRWAPPPKPAPAKLKAGAG